MMQKIYILVYGRMPTEKAYGIHALNQAKSFFELGYDVTLVYPKTNNQQTIYESLSDYYQENVCMDCIIMSLVFKSKKKN